MYKIKEVMPTFKDYYYYDDKVNKIYSKRGDTYRELLVENGGVRLNTDGGKRSRVLLEDVRSSVMRSVSRPSYRLQIEDLIQDQFWEEKVFLSSVATTDLLNNSHHVKRLRRDEAESLLKERYSIQESESKNLVEEILKFPSVCLEEGYLCFKHYQEDSGYVNLTDEEMSSISAHFNTTLRVLALFKWWSLSGTKQISFNIKQIAHFLNIEYNNSKKRKVLSEAISSVLREYMRDVKEEFVCSDGYGYVMFKARYKGCAPPTPVDETILFLREKFGEKLSNEKFVDALFNKIKEQL